MAFSLFAILAVCVYQIHGQMQGGYNTVTSSTQLQSIEDMLVSVRSDLITLLTSNGCTSCSVNDTLTVSSAEYQVVAGYNYRAHITIGDTSNAPEYDVQFYVPLPVNGTQQLPQNLQLYDATATTTTSPSTTSDLMAGGYHPVTDSSQLQYIHDELDAVKSDLITLLNANGCNGGACSVDDTLSVLSAYYQDVAGYNYRAQIAIADTANSYRQVYEVQFYVALPVNGTQQLPTNLRLVDDSMTTSTPTTTSSRVVGGYHLITDDAELANVYNLLNTVKADLFTLLNDNGCNDGACSVDYTFSVSSAYYQVVAGYNYRAHITVCDAADASSCDYYNEYDVQFYVPLPVNGVDQNATDLQLFSWTTTESPTTTVSTTGSIWAGGWMQVTDSDALAEIEAMLEDVRPTVIALVTEYGCDDCSVNDTFSVWTAQSQVVAGTNYRVLLGIGDFPDSQEFKLQFFVPLPINGVTQKPQMFQVLDSSLSDDEDESEMVAMTVGAMYTMITVVVVVLLCCLVSIIAVICCMKSKGKSKGDQYNTLLDENDHTLELSKPYSLEHRV